MKYKRVDIGSIIKDLVKERGLSYAKFADMIQMKRQNIEKTIFLKASIDTNILILISEVLEEDLFKYYRLTGVDNDFCNECYYKNNFDQEIKATLSIELKKEKKEQVLKLVFGDNNLEILNK